MWVRVFDDTQQTDGGEGGGRGFEIRPLPGERLQLRLWGPLPRRWAEGVCSGLARARITIESGLARRDASDGWFASFQVAAGAALQDPLSLDLLELSLHPPTPAAWIPMRVEGYALRDDPALGALRLDLFGPDQHGFLGGLLERLAFLGLAPVEMVIETSEHGLYDILHLQTTDGRVPSGVHRRAVEELLGGCVFEGDHR